MFDLARAKARIGHHRRVTPDCPKLHFGCGNRRIPGWLNVDVAGSDFDVDLGGGSLPWHNDVFESAVGQHVIEHLELHSQLLPFLTELRRVCRPSAKIWLSCPSMKAVCEDYLKRKGGGMLSDRRSRVPDFDLGGAPPQHMINELFTQRGEHKNLFDFELLQWATSTSGFTACVEVQENDLRDAFPEFPPRSDGFQTLYVCATA